tara:strand:+ start:323 stop:772 length:450 start_codon:yes stop_codon:yes gene_type:complete
MATIHTAGTEIIRNVQHYEVTDTAATLIVGVQHHIYTILNVTVYAHALGSAGNPFYLRIKSWNAFAAGSGVHHYLVKQPMQVGETFVWDTKVSFNGFEPTGVSSTLNTDTEQDAIADQGGSVSNKLDLHSASSSDRLHVFCTYIDQNNS